MHAHIGVLPIVALAVAGVIIVVTIVAVKHLKRVPLIKRLSVAMIMFGLAGLVASFAFGYAPIYKMVNGHEFTWNYVAVYSGLLLTVSFVPLIIISSFGSNSRGKTR